MDPFNSYVFSNSTLVEVLDDLCVRFLINVPEEELSTIERICFQIEEAQWYFEDFVREQNPALPTLQLRTFISKIFAHCPLQLLSSLPAERAENAFYEFMAYKTRVPVRGAIMLNPAMDRCVLVKGWKSGASWSFPRGKINQDERDADCAVREVREETGFDAKGMVMEDDFIEIAMREQNMRLYIIPGIPENTHFEPKTRKEISKIQWHHLSELPAFGKRKNQNVNPVGVKTGKYYMVAPFLRELRTWISTKGKKWTLKQKELARAAALVKEETEVEEETVDECLDTVDNETASRKLKDMLSFPTVTEQPGDSSKKLKDILHVPAAAVPLPQSENPSAKLKSLLKGGDGFSQPGPDSNALLSMLQNGSGQAQASHPSAQHESSVSYQTPHGPQSDFQSHYMSNPAGWSQFPSSNVLSPYLPSPPPASFFGIPPHPNFGPPHLQDPSRHPHNHHQFQQESSHPQPIQDPRTRFQPDMSRIAQQPPPTPLETFIYPPIPTKPPDPGQAGALLSILKSGGGPPAPVPAPVPAAPAPVQTVTPTPPQTLPSTPIALQQPPPRGPKTPTLGKQNKISFLTTLRSNPNGNPRASTTAPQAKAFAPPPRPTTTQPITYRKPPPSTPKRASTPVTAPSSTAQAASQYGAPSITPAVRAMDFDRRESTSKGQAQALLAMFRNAPVSSQAPSAEEAISSSPEQEFAKPVVVNQAQTLLAIFKSSTASPLQTSVEQIIIPSGSEQAGIHRPAFVRKGSSAIALGERAGLMAYLEGVAKGGGQ